MIPYQVKLFSSLQLQNIYLDSDSETKRRIRRRLNDLVNCLYFENNDNDPKEKERQVLHERLKNFDEKQCRAYRELERRGLISMTHVNLVQIAKVIAHRCEIKLDREAKRRKPILIKWFDENYDKAIPLLDKMELQYQEDNDTDNPQEENNGGTKSSISCK